MGTIENVPESPTAAALQEFEDLVYSDADVVRAEFDAIIAAEWPSRPTPVSSRKPAWDFTTPRHRPREASPALPHRPRRPGTGGLVRQRSPPVRH